jgi:hypothetical protein
MSKSEKFAIVVHAGSNELPRAVHGLLGVCDLCSGAFGVKQEVGQSGLPTKDAYTGHLSFGQLVIDGFFPVII